MKLNILVAFIKKCKKCDRNFNCHLTDRLISKKTKIQGKGKVELSLKV